MIWRVDWFVARISRRIQIDLLNSYRLLIEVYFGPRDHGETYENDRDNSEPEAVDPLQRKGLLNSGCQSETLRRR